MGATLNLTAAETKPDIVTWKPVNWLLDRTVPSMKVTFEAETGERRVWRLVPSASVTAAQIRAGLKYVNEGKFATVRGITLEQWLVEQWQANGGPAGSISVTVD